MDHRSRKRRKQRDPFKHRRRPVQAPAPHPPPELLALVVCRPCLLCRGPADVAGIWCPNDQTAFRAPRGKVRFFAYALCLACHRRPDAMQAVERVIFAEAADPGRN